MPLGYGLTLWKLALINKTASNIPYVVAHEAEHVRQWAEEGFFRFIWLYGKELIANGYRANKYEVMARAEGSRNQWRYNEYRL